MQIEMGTLAEDEYMQQAQAAVKREEVMEITVICRYLSYAGYMQREQSAVNWGELIFCC